MSTEILDQLRAAIVDLKGDEAAKLAKDAIKSGIDPVKVIEQGLRPSLDLLEKKLPRIRKRD